MRLLEPHRPALATALVLLLIEVCIAWFVRDRFVRPYVGDVLVIPLIFFTVYGLMRVAPTPLASGVLLFAFAVESAQAFGLVHRLGLAHSTVARTVLGDTFQPGDLLAYLLGAVLSLTAVKGIPVFRRD
jgi:Protein of unknown function (DUF2809)